MLLKKEDIQSAMETISRELEIPTPILVYTWKGERAWCRWSRDEKRPKVCLGPKVWLGMKQALIHEMAHAFLSTKGHFNHGHDATFIRVLKQVIIIAQEKLNWTYDPSVEYPHVALALGSVAIMGRDRTKEKTIQAIMQTGKTREQAEAIVNG